MSRSVPVPVRLIGLLQMLGGGLTVLWGLGLTLYCLVGMLFGGGGGGFISLGADMFVFAIVLLAIVIAVGGLGIATGAALCKGRRWARTLVVALSLLQALAALASWSLLPALLPLGIAGYLGLSESVARAFHR